MSDTTCVDAQTKLALAGPQPGGDESQPGFLPAATLAPVPAPLQVSDPISPSLAGGPEPNLPRCPGETPRAFSAFMTYFQLGRGRSSVAVADKLGETHGTVRNWSSKFRWAERIHAYQAGLLQAQARQHAAGQLQQAADWNRRLLDLREQEWAAAQKLNVVAQCFLETCGDDDLRRMTLAQASRALQISSSVARSAIAGAELPAAPETGLSPLQEQLLAGLTRIYGPAATSATLNSQPSALSL